ncbi:DNA repair protein RecO [Cuneatibacter sp. NSJ-177]|uniref:DNA repair protein RecO n=1 Tax=Cuneatibacter sp. NSJ-177 TaxID=2931401 RepID=UPI001FD5B34B|nr:DNA repair protein RecO [Cuneatibacter sp. NSJ-177]MCJ7835565.1 DNA repair protein RecO [Cuneatibacter sp. NSJ-177]
MSDLITVTGMVLSSMPIAEYDRRLVILTRERGKISAFAKGARRPNSSLLAGSRTFSFGTMELYEGRTSYNVRSMEIQNYFENLSTDLELACYGSYFMEFVDYYGKEGIDGTPLLKLCYVTLLALGKPNLDRQLVRYIFELKAMAESGEYAEQPLKPVGEAAAYAWKFVLNTRPEKLYTFALEEHAKKEFISAVEELKRYYLDREFKSLEILEGISKIGLPDR